MRGRPLVIHWQETPEELEERFRRERNGHRRARLQALTMLRAGKPLDEVSRAVAVDYRTVQRWIAWYREGGLEAVVQRTPGYAAPGRPSRLSREQRDALLAQVDAGAFRTVWDAVRWVAREFGVTYTYTGMHALINRSLPLAATQQAVAAPALSAAFQLQPPEAVPASSPRKPQR